MCTILFFMFYMLDWSHDVAGWCDAEALHQSRSPVTAPVSGSELSCFPSAPHVKPSSRGAAHRGAVVVSGGDG